MKPHTMATAYRTTPRAYGELAPVGTSAAEKLAASAVAPLVAAARGYRTVEAFHEFEDLAKELGYTHKGNTAYKETRKACTEGNDGFLMPWYKGSALRQTDPKPACWQIRPSDPATDKTGRLKKYVTAPGISQPLDIHPATPAEWLEHSPVIFFSEGLLKGDAAISAYLTAQGADAELLQYTGEDARQKLTDFMEDIPAENRVLIVRVASVTTFHKDASLYNGIDFPGAAVWLGVDGDVTTNPMVWDHTKKAFDRMSKQGARSVFLLAPTVAGDKKAGIDDFLAAHGDWNELMRFKAPKLPDRPTDDGEELEVGQWRVAQEGTRCEAKVSIRDEQGNEVGYDWENKYDLGAQITAYKCQRKPTPQEMLTGTIEGSGGWERDEVEITFRWEKHGQEHSGIAALPVKLLAESVDRWHNKEETDLPLELLAHPAFPPTGGEAREFMSAVRRVDSQPRFKVAWERNGWVPVQGSTPAFLIGKDVVAADETAAASVHSAVDTDHLASIDQFGIGGPEKDFIPHPGMELGRMDPRSGWKPSPNGDARAKQKQIMEDVSLLRKLFFDAKPFTGDAVPALVLAAALRPILVAHPPAAPLYFYGEKGKGKSWSATCVLHFWASRFTGFEGRLPGSASDTTTAHEIVVSRMPIWVVDDLAPSSAEKTYQARESALEDLIRRTFNHEGKQRGTGDVQMRKVNMPYAQLIATGENPLSTSSAAERAIRIPVTNGFLNPDRSTTKAIDRAAGTGVFARITRHFAEWMVHRVARHGWKQVRDETDRLFRSCADYAEEEIPARGGNPESLDRDARLTSEMTTTLITFKQFLLEAGITWPDLLGDCVDPGDPGGAYDGDLFDAILDHMAEQSANSQESTPGLRLLSAIKAALAAGQIHVTGEHNPSHPPVKEPMVGNKYPRPDQTSSERRQNRGLGWTRGDRIPEPSGTPVGDLVAHKGESVVMLKQQVTFEAVRRAQPELIRPGEKSIQMWASLLTTNKVKTDVPLKDKKARGVYRITKNGKKFEGVPVKLSALLDS